MTVMTMDDLCGDCKNWFDDNRIFGKFTIQDGILIDGDQYLQNGQYYRIIGSKFNDGVHQHPAPFLTDETFDGAVWTMAVPLAFSKVLDEINAWLSEYGEEADKPYQSESFAGYSYTKGTGANGQTGALGLALAHFASTLKRWRKIR